MPLVAVSEDRRLLSTELTDDAWAELRATYRQAQLRMTCGQPAIPKTSKNGLRFFAHHPGGDCGLHLSGPESAEHQNAKMALAAAAERAGWAATIEAVAPDRTWIADVLIERGQTRVALDVQWSAQTETVFAERTARYAAAGVECVWFLGPHNHGKRVERSYLLAGGPDDLTVSVPGVPGTGREEIPLAAGADRMLNGELSAPLNLHMSGVVISYLVFDCYRSECGARYSRWWLGGLRGRSRCGWDVQLELLQTGHGVIPGAEGMQWESAGAPGEQSSGPLWGSFAQARPETQIPAEIARALSSARIPTPCGYGRRRSQQVPYGYIGALCPRCGALQGDGFIGGNLLVTDAKEITLPFEAKVTIPAAALDDRHWCRDAGDRRCTPGPVGFPFPAPHQRVFAFPTS